MIGAGHMVRPLRNHFRRILRGDLPERAVALRSIIPAVGEPVVAGPFPDVFESNLSKGAECRGERDIGQLQSFSFTPGGRTRWRARNARMFSSAPGVQLRYRRKCFFAGDDLAHVGRVKHDQLSARPSGSAASSCSSSEGGHRWSCPT